MNEVAILTESLGKKYNITRSQAAYKTIRDSIADAFSSPKNWFSSQQSEKFWALKDVSLTINRGDVVGVIGRNGSGKTTLLKIFSRITKPTSGRAEINGRVGSLLEVGTGFHQELTGRENIFLNGAILGMTRKEIKRKFDQIVAFSEIERFLDTPVKRYSSGMYVRLAFSVAAHLEPEVLLVDEILAVGDTAFQKKCLGKMDELAGAGRTVLFVSHNLGIVSQLCKQTLWLNEGEFVKMGNTQDVIHDYLMFSTASTDITWRTSSITKKNIGVQLLSASILVDKVPTAIVNFDQDFCLEVKYKVEKVTEAWSLIFRIKNTSGVAVFTSWDTDGLDTHKPSEVGTYWATCHLPGKFLRPGTYSITLGVYVPRARTFDIEEDIFKFEVSSIGYPLNKDRLGVITPILKWSIHQTPEAVT